MRGFIKSYFLPVLLFLGSLSLCLSFGLKVRQIIGDDIYILTIPDDRKSFSAFDLFYFDKDNIQMTFEQPVAAEISNGFRRENIRISATNENYAYFTNMGILQGTFFNEIQIERKYRLAVLNESASYKLFGTVDGVGQIIYLNRVPYKVTGIVKEQEENAEAKIYISYTVLEDAGDELSVNQIWCRLENPAEAALISDQLGYSIKTINMVRTNDLKGIFMQRFWISILLIDLCVLVYLLIKLWRNKQWLKSKRLLAFGLMICSVISIGIAYMVMKQAVYIPPVYELSGESWKSIICKLLDFYILAGININNMAYLYYWNVFSLLSFIICINSGMVIYIVYLRNKLRVASVCDKLELKENTIESNNSDENIDALIKCVLNERAGRCEAPDGLKERIDRGIKSNRNL